MTVEAEISEIELKQIFNTSADGMWVIDEQFNVQRINETLLKFLGKNKNETVGRKCHDIFSGSICRTADCPIIRLKNGENHIECDIEKIREDGTKIPFILTATPFRGLDGGFIGIVEDLKDITERKRAEAALHKANKELKRIATMDGLTRVANRRRFDECLATEWKRMRREKTPLSLIMCDIDYFKRYNDAYGHQKGDDCLRAVAQAIDECLKRPADMVARYGGEEFGIILPNTHADGAFHVAEIIRNAIGSLKIPHAKSNVDDYVSLSLGVSCVIPSPGGALETLVGTADKALYLAKNQGRNQVVLRSFDN
ncbi:MAG: sensor domain-containing diguanylate cyclase [Planctomycetota bacterium]|jgi:diguanylate cyclase (GGDEF)-like protein/PAS domain S-box-containing protein